ncbi:beta-ketoacyl-[acyl-carrier-protein] synthase family protein [Patulibacter sp. NPDC049589]|uniref:beta-ketoacyl-[acyl-carrier-protein] synthase family protein n=1 Tax=Patulibacter sp. NPDC049589 TaxID=3154731 RepID=UPI00343202A4
MTRVVVTGLGAITPAGPDAASTWSAIVEGRSAVRPTSAFDASDLDARIAATIEGFDPVALLGRKRANRTATFSQYAVAAAREAVADAGVVIDEELAGRVAVCLNTAVSGIGPADQANAALLADGPGAVSAYYVPQMIPSVPACEVAIDLGVHGPVTAAALACASGTAAVLDARRMLLSGEADVAIAGGTDAPHTRSLMAGLGRMGALSRNNDDPEGACRPFDVDRDGFVPSEGAVVFVLEREEDARARGARIHGAVLGGALTSDAYHLSAPDRDGRYASEAIRLTLERSGLDPVDVDWLCAHGTGTPANDRTETLAIRRAFGAAVDEVAVSSPKSVLGHMMGGAGALSLLACLLAIRDDRIPPTINLENVDPACELDHVANVARETPVRVAVADAFGFGGQNCVVAVGAA